MSLAQLPSGSLMTGSCFQLQFLEFVEDTEVTDHTESQDTVGNCSPCTCQQAHTARCDSQSNRQVTLNTSLLTAACLLIHAPFLSPTCSPFYHSEALLSPDSPTTHNPLPSHSASKAPLSCQCLHIAAAHR